MIKLIVIIAIPKYKKSNRKWPFLEKICYDLSSGLFSKLDNFIHHEIDIPTHPHPLEICVDPELVRSISIKK